MYLVTGGCGLVGQAIVAQLLARGERVRVFDLKPHPDSRVESMVGDLRSPAEVAKACSGVETVFHTAAMINVSPGKPTGMYEVNVGGTQNVIKACEARKVKKLIHTSTEDVVFDFRPVADGDETEPYPRRYAHYYSETKTLAEQAVVASNSPKGLLTCAIRPTGVYGKHDRARFPNILSLAKQGSFFRIGDGSGRQNYVYAENLAHAHLLASDCLAPDSPVGGSIYVITDHEPINFFDFVLPFVQSCGFDPVVKSMSFTVAYGIASATEAMWYLAPRRVMTGVPLTRYIAYSLTHDFWFNSKKAAKELGYQPIVSQKEAFDRTTEWLKETLLPTL